MEISLEKVKALSHPYYKNLPKKCKLYVRSMIPDYMLMAYTAATIKERVQREMLDKVAEHLLKDNRVVFQEHSEDQCTVITGQCFVFTPEELQAFIVKTVYGVLDILEEERK